VDENGGLGAIIEKMVTNPQAAKRGEAGWQVRLQASRESSKTVMTPRGTNTRSAQGTRQIRRLKAPGACDMQYCGATFTTAGHRSFTKKNEVMIWFKEPERCTCVMAKAILAITKQRSCREKERTPQGAERIQQE
jgi:hypothetical protein